MAPFVTNPELLDELSGVVFGKRSMQHSASTHPDNRYAIMFIGLEAGSVRLLKQHVKGKTYPFRPEQWPDVIPKGMETQNKYNWFPICTSIIGQPPA